MERISFSGQLTKDELAAAVRMGRIIKIWHIIVFCFFLAIFLVVLMSRHPYGSNFPTGLSLIFIFLLIGIIYYFTPAISANKMFDEDSEFKYLLSGIISDEGLSVQSSRTQTQIQWNLYKFARFSPEYVLLYQTNNCLNIFHRKFFTGEADWKAFRSLVEQKIAKKTYSKKDPAAPAFSRYARTRNLYFLVFGITLLMVVFIIIYSYLTA